MVKVIHTTIDPYIEEDLNKLYACNKISAMIWNKILELSSYYRKITCGKWISEFELKQILKNAYPYKIKHHYLSIWKADGFKIKDDILELSLGMFNRKRQKPIKIKLSKKILNELKDKKYGK